MIKFDITKDHRQEESTIKWRNNNGIGCINACPRFGKTQIALKIIEKNRAKNPKSKIIVIVPSESIEKHWNDKIDSVNILTIHKAKLSIDAIMKATTYIDILIVDELHKYTSDDNRLLIIELAKMSKFRLALTGTYPDDKKLQYWFPVIDTISESEALEKGWISDFIEYNLPIDLTKEEKTKYNIYSSFITETMNLFKGKANVVNEGTHFIKDDLDLIYTCYSGKTHNRKYIPGDAFRQALAKHMGWNRDLDLSNPSNRERDVYWNPNNLYERCKQFKIYVTNRNEILINNENKLNLLKEILNRNPVPTIIFNESIDFVNTVADELGTKAIAYHSKIKSRPIIDPETNELIKFKTGRVKMFGATHLKNEAIEGIKTGKYLYLVTVKSLDEGLDLPKLEQVIITAGSANPLQQLQRSARGKTIDSDNENKVTKIFNLYIDDFYDDFGFLVKSRDKMKLIERQKRYSHSVKWVNSISEIS